MRKLLKRRYVWLGLVLLLGLAGSAALICPGRGRITQANFDRIQDGMSLPQVTEILGEMNGPYGLTSIGSGWRTWSSGPNRISVRLFLGDKVVGKKIHLASPSETLKWYANRGAAKIGINMD